MKRFLQRSIPELRRLLLVESGSRAVSGKWLAKLPAIAPEARVDLLTCFDEASTAAQIEHVFRTTDYRTGAARAELLNDLARTGYDAVVILCTTEPLMTKWKWYSAWKIPSKILIVNENADSFWMDRGHLGSIRQFVSHRAGLSGSGALTQPLKLILFPITLTYLLLYAGGIQLRRRFVR